MRNLLLALLAVPVLLGANQAHALNLCARIDKATGEPREGASIKLRSQCRLGEAAIGSTEEFARLRADVDANSEAIDAALSDGEHGRIAASRPATTAKAANGCGLMVTGDGAFFEKCNVHVQSGSGSTSGTINGFGNLIVGYDEPSGGDKTGSHNLIVGPYHSYPSYGGFLAGYGNTASGLYSSVLGGGFNDAIGNYSSVSGGGSNTARGDSASVSGGYSNDASILYSSVLGGDNNEASGLRSSVLGGQNNTASGENSIAP